MHANRFLQWLDPSALRFVFQTFDDFKNGRGGFSVSSSSFDPALQNLNGNGFGISVTINELKSDSRRSEQVTRIRAVWFDDDFW